MSEEIVKIKGSAAGGLQLTFAPQATFASIYDDIRAKLTDGNGFFLRGTLVQFPREVFSDDERSQLTKLFHKYGLIFRPLESGTASHSGHERHSFASSLLDQETPAATATALPNWMNEAVAAAENAQSEAPAAEPDPAPKATAAEPAASPAPAESAPEPPAVQEMVVVNRTLRGGQEIRTQSSVLVCGNVNPGAQIIAGGSIDIRGTCRGVVHAGAYGDTSAFIVADQLIPTQIRIASLIARSPDAPAGSSEQSAGAERASIKDGQIVIEPIKR